tara:strand:+ start:216 stop:650 length:435 start_codon:yes stop_codon:yes gene_type:complete
MTNMHEKFQTYLEEKDQRYSAQKKEIFDAIIKQNDHFEIDSFISEMYTKGRNFSRATVYRTVKQLLDAKLIQKIAAQDGKVFYECNEELEHHDHIICNQCGKIFEIKDKSIEKKIQEECNKINFKIEYRSVHIYGICEACIKKG